MRRAELGHLAPGRQLRWSHVLPVFPALARDPDQAIVRACPDRAHVLVRQAERVDYATLFVGIGVLRGEVAQASRNAGMLAREVRADGLPGLSAVGCFEQHIGGVIEAVRIDGGKEDWLRAVGAVLAAADR